MFFVGFCYDMLLLHIELKLHRKININYTNKRKGSRGERKGERKGLALRKRGKIINQT